VRALRPPCVIAFVQRVFPVREGRLQDGAVRSPRQCVGKEFTTYERKHHALVPPPSLVAERLAEEAGVWLVGAQ
jgi:hypothetical protein